MIENDLDIGIPSATLFDNLKDINRDVWIKTVFPEWGTYLNKRIERTKVDNRSFVLWWLGGCGFYMKTAKSNLIIDNYSGPSAFTRYKDNDGFCRLSGAEYIEWLRINPHVIDPFAINECDLLLSTHPHADHCDPFTIVPLSKNTDAKFIGPKLSCKVFKKYISKKKIIQVKPGDRVSINDVEIIVTSSYDLTSILDGYEPSGNFDDSCVCYLIKTKNGNLFHIGESLYSNAFFKIGKEHKIDIACLNFGDNPPGVTNKMSVYDCARTAVALKTKIMIPMHYDNQAIIHGNPYELEKLMEKKFSWIKTVIMQWGGQFTYPQDEDIRRYRYPKYTERFNPNISWEYGDNPKILLNIKKT